MAYLGMPNNTRLSGIWRPGGHIFGNAPPMSIVTSTLHHFGRHLGAPENVIVNVSLSSNFKVNQIDGDKKSYLCLNYLFIIKRNYGLAV